MERPIIFKYLNYRLFLSDLVDFEKFRKNFSVRKFAIESGIGSFSYLGSVLDEKRSLTLSSARKVCKGFSLDRKETEFLLKLVEFEHAETPSEKNKVFQKILKLQRSHNTKSLLLENYAYFSNWYMVVIFVALNTAWSALNETDMAKSIGISKKDLKHALEILKRLGLAEKKGSTWIGKDLALKTPTEMLSLNIRNFHRQMIQKSLESLDKVHPDHREVGALTLSLNEADFSKMKRKISRFREDLSLEFGKSKKPTKVYQLNIQLFPVLTILEDN